MKIQSSFSPSYPTLDVKKKPKLEKQFFNSKTIFSFRNHWAILQLHVITHLKKIKFLKANMYYFSVCVCVCVCVCIPCLQYVKIQTYVDSVWDDVAESQPSWHLWMKYFLTSRVEEIDKIKSGSIAKPLYHKTKLILIHLSTS